MKKLFASILAAGMILSLTACDESVPTGGTSAGAPSATTSGTTATTTTYAPDANVQEKVGNIADKLDNPDLDVTKRLKWMAWWDMDETTPAAELFKDVYGVPETGDDATREGRIFEYQSVVYGERYDKLATAIQSGDSPDLFPFEIRDFPYGVLKGRYQPVDEILDLESEKWDGARGVMDQFKLNDRYYCAIYEISFESLLYYRKSVVDQLAMGDPREMFENDEWTWDTFLEFARAFKNSGDNKYAIDGWFPTNQFVVSTGVPLVGNDGTQITNNLYDPAVERAMGLLKTLQEENLRYPRHEVNGWQINLKAWVSGDTLFWGNGGTWEYEGDAGLNKFALKQKWDDNEIVAIPYPRDPNADAYYHFMKQDATMWCKGSENSAGVAAWIDCCVTAALDPEVTAAAKQQLKDKHNWTDYNLDFIYSLTTLDGSSKLTPVFDFKNVLGDDISDSGKAESPIESLTQFVYLTGQESYTQLREANNATIQSRIDEINDAIKG